MGNPNDDHMLKYIQKYFPNLIIYTDKRSDLPLIQCGHNAEIINFANKVYKDAIIYLPRKKQKFDLVRFTNLIGTSTTTRETTKELVEDIV
jgi:phosphoserine phosphatase